MPIPSRKDFEDPKPVREEYSPEEAKRIVTNATMKALRILETIIDDNTASASERRAAAKDIIEIGHGSKLKDLNIISEEIDVAQMIADAIKEAKNGP